MAKEKGTKKAGAKGQQRPKQLALMSLKHNRKERDTQDGLGWLEELREQNPEAVTADGFESCVLGIGNRCGASPIVAYDYDKCVALLVQRDGMTEEDAIEFMSFNVVGAWVGEGTPVFVSTQRW